ncbi:hypothetical protein [Nocardia sp. NBC_00511]|uniref:hypothetical protein n=1 Tax=Nocardia sp. NBC_00511 TaxID=2903591 RepID=UPI0030E0E90C
MGRKVTAGFVAGVGVTVALLSGCSSNAGGDTTCKDFLKQDTSKQTDTITKFLKDKGKNPTGLEVTANRVSAAAFCKTLGKQDSKVRDIDHG